MSRRQIVDFLFAETDGWAGEVRRLVRFGVAGVLNASFYFVVFAGMVGLDLVPVYVAQALAMVLGVLFSFVTHGGGVFMDLRLERLPRFVLLYLIIYLINVISVEGITWLEFDVLVAQACVLPMLALLSYVAMRQRVFRSTTRP